MSGRIPSSGPRRLPPPGPALFLTLVHHRAPERKNAGPNLLSVGPASETGGIEKLAARRRTPSCDACLIVKSAGVAPPALARGRGGGGGCCPVGRTAEGKRRGGGGGPPPPPLAQRE